MYLSQGRNPGNPAAPRVTLPAPPGPAPEMLSRIGPFRHRLGFAH
jgi:hypothetical protein